MNLVDAEKEFWLRNYVWAKAEWEKEINESFPHLRMFKTGHAWEIYLIEQDVELACDETFKYCRRFFEAAPKLLKGLEFENITAN
jgi:hypothetical protein